MCGGRTYDDFQHQILAVKLGPLHVAHAVVALRQAIQNLPAKRKGREGGDNVERWKAEGMQARRKTL